VIRQVWPAPHGHSLLSPFEASEDFTQACWKADEVIATSPSDLFYSFTLAGEEVVRLIVVDHPELDPGYGIPERQTDSKSTSSKSPSGAAAARDWARRPSNCCAASIQDGSSSPVRPRARMPSGSPWGGNTCDTGTGTIPRCSWAADGPQPAAPAETRS
jgi:hypothetical protein